MRFTIYGKPIVHHHVCSPDRLGCTMTQQELQDFAIAALVEEYERCGHREVVYHSEDFRSGADFSFKYSGMTVCGKVAYMRDLTNDDIEVDYSLLLSNYRNGHDIAPRLYKATACCVSSQDGALECGGDYIFDFIPISLMLDEKDPDLDEVLSHTQLVQKYIEMWETGDTSIALKYFYKFFRSYAVSCFNPLVSRKEYLQFFTHNSRRANQDELLTMRLCRNTKTGEVAILARDNWRANSLVVSIKTDNGRIIESITRMATPDFVEFDPQDEPHQCHGDHIEAIMPPGRFMEECLPRITRESVNYEKAYIRPHFFTSVKYIDNGRDFLTVLDWRNGMKARQLVTAYPYLDGNVLTVEIDSVLPWDSLAEATVICHIDDFTFGFFATDYYAHRDLYASGNLLNINFSALGIKVNPGNEGFSFEGQKALDFLAKMGEHPDLDEDGVIEPVNFSLKELVAYFSNDERCLDEAQFQSPISNIEQVSLLGVDFYKVDIIINRDNNVTVPLYFSKEQSVTPSVGHPVCGYLWLMGRIQPTASEKAIIDMCAIGSDFRYTICSFDFKSFNELNFLLQPLKDVSLPDGFDLDGVFVGDRQNRITQLYATRNKRKFEPVINSDGIVTNVMKDDMYLSGLTPQNVAVAIPPLDRYLVVENSVAGIWSAFLLKMAKYFLPGVQQTLYHNKYYILSLNDFDATRLVGHTELRNTDILPLIRYINKDQGTLRATYWNDCRGLIRETFDFVWHDNSVQFTLRSSETLVDYALANMY